MKVTDKYFGDVEVSFDKETAIYSLCKQIEIHGVRETMYLYIESDEMVSSDRQQQTYDLVIANFTLIYKNVLLFLTANKGYHIEDFPRYYRIESLTFLRQSEPENGQWILDMLDLKDGSSHIVVELVDLNPINFSVRAQNAQQ